MYYFGNNDKEKSVHLSAQATILGLTTECTSATM